MYFWVRQVWDLAIVLGAEQVWTCLYPWGGPGPKECCTPLGQGKSGLANTPGAEQVWTRLYPWGRAGLNLPIPLTYAFDEGLASLDLPVGQESPWVWARLDLSKTLAQTGLNLSPLAL